MSFAPVLAAPSRTPACNPGNNSGHLLYGGLRALKTTEAPSLAFRVKASSLASPPTTSTPPGTAALPLRLTIRTRLPIWTSSSITDIPTGPVPKTTCSSPLSAILCFSSPPWLVTPVPRCRLARPAAEHQQHRQAGDSREDQRARRTKHVNAALDIHASRPRHCPAQRPGDRHDRNPQACDEKPAPQEEAPLQQPHRDA